MVKAVLERVTDRYDPQPGKYGDGAQTRSQEYEGTQATTQRDQQGTDLWV